MSDILARNALYTPRGGPRARERRGRSIVVDMPMQDPLSLESVERRVLRACKTVRVLPDKENKWRYGSLDNPMWAQAAREWTAYGAVEEAVRFIPEPSDVSDVLIALAWTRAISKAQFRLVWARSFDLSFGTIARKIGRDRETARNWYRRAISEVHDEALRSHRSLQGSPG
jgi:hypothetical protein